MASPTRGKPITKIILTYDEKAQRVTSEPPSPLKFQKGDEITFFSKGDEAVYVNLEDPKAYKPNEFTPLSGAVEVLTHATGKSRQTQCGFVKVEGGVLRGYGWLPDDVKKVVQYDNTLIVKHAYGPTMDP